MEEIPQIITKWTSSTRGISDFRASDWLSTWKSRVISTIIASFRRQDILHVPPEYIELHMSTDQTCLEHLWIRICGEDSLTMDLGRSRFMLDSLLVQRSDIKLSASDYTEWLKELLSLLHAEVESGLIRKDLFLKLAGLWFSSRLWFVPRRRTVIEEIIHAWDIVDVSGCGVVSPPTLSAVLLPFAYRVLYPETGSDDTLLKNAWIQRMFSCVSCLKSDWVNHWTEFAHMELTAFKDVLTDRGTREHVATQALKFFKINYNSLTLVDFESLFELAGKSKELQCRLFTLWLVTLNHGNCNYSLSSPAERLLGSEAVLRNQAAFRSYCRDIWASYIPPSNADMKTAEQGKQLFNEWMEKLAERVSLPCPEGSLLILRNDLVDRFLREEEVEALWNGFCGTTARNMRPHHLVAMLKSIYDRECSPMSPGPYIIDEWMESIVSLAMYVGRSSSPVITRSSFKQVFPLWYSSFSLKPLERSDAKDWEKLWPSSQANRLVYSGPHLRNILRTVWTTTIPEELNLPCQEWWVDRCMETLEKKGKGVTRDSLYSMFPSQQECARILSSIKQLDGRTLSKLLSNSVLSGKDADGLLPTDWVAEFFLIADLSMNEPAAVTRDQFMFAFPLWHAAHCVN